MLESVLQSLGQCGFAVIPQLADAATLDAMRCESAALLERAESDVQTSGYDASEGPVAERMGCIFQVLPELEQAASTHNAAITDAHSIVTDPAAYWALRTTWPYAPVTANFLRSQPLLQLLQKALGSQSVLLYNEQYIIKSPHSSSSCFRWHYDSQWCNSQRGVQYSPYLSIWVALDDMTAENGCLVVLPRTHQAVETPSTVLRSSRNTQTQSCTAVDAVDGASQQLAGTATQQQLQQVVNEQHQVLDAVAAHSETLHDLQEPRTHPHPAATSTGSYSDPYHGGLHGTASQDSTQHAVQYVAVSSSQQVFNLLTTSKSSCCGSPRVMGYDSSPSQNPTLDGTGSQQSPPDCSRPLGLIVPAGTALLFWDTLWHCSGPNNSRHTRTAYMAQFSSRPLLWKDSSQPVALAVQLC